LWVVVHSALASEARQCSGWVLGGAIFKAYKMNQFVFHIDFTMKMQMATTMGNPKKKEKNQFVPYMIS